MKTNYIKPEIKEVVLDSEDLLIVVGVSQEHEQVLSKGNSSFDKDDADWDD